MKSRITLVSIITLSALTAWNIQAVENSQHSIDTVMKEAMKGSNSLYKKVSLGQGSDSDIATLLDYFKSLPAETPPVGDSASWNEKTSTLIAAVQAVAEKKPNAISELQVAGNCKACHSIHKGN